MRFTPQLAALALASTTACGAFAQATVTPDGQWRSALSLGVSLSSGNTKSSNLMFAGDTVKATAQDKLRMYGVALRSSADGSTTANQFRLGGRYDYNLSAAYFGYGGLDFESDKIGAKLNSRIALGAGLGWHVIKDAATTFDVFGGVAQTADRFTQALTIDGSSRMRYSYTSLVLGEESSHKLSPTMTFSQRMTLLPNLKNTGEFRAVFDAGLAVAVSKGMNVNIGFSHRYNSEPGTGIKKGDTLLTTGVSVKFD